MTDVEPPLRRRRRASISRWAVTIAATVVSIWALDIVAAAAGLLLMASPLFEQTPYGVVIALLVVSYLAWGAGLRINLMANWRLLEETGTSTNAPSKLMFELARHRGARPSAARAASAAGYIATEIAKEVPYYVGAFGTALLSDDLDSTDALVFLVGANLGAAGYEVTVARLTRAYLERRAKRVLSLQSTSGPASATGGGDTTWATGETW